ncbi:MAG: hypothetical protein AAGJ85_00520 [Pseudomonadota bacterium]
MSKVISLSTLALAMAVLNNAYAQETGMTVTRDDTIPEKSRVAGEWNLEIPEFRQVDSADAGREADFTAAIEKVSIDVGENKRIILTCQVIRQDGELRDTRLQVGFDLDTSKQDFTRNLNIRRKTGKVTIADNTLSYRFQWNVKTDTFVPFDRTLARRMFNAAVRGDNVKLRINSKLGFEIDLPEMNEDFKSFARGCPATKS